MSYPAAQTTSIHSACARAFLSRAFRKRSFLQQRNDTNSNPSMDCGQIPLVAMKQQPLRPTGRHCRLLPVLYTSTTLWFLRTAPIALAIPSPLTTSQQQQQHQRGISTNSNNNMSASSTQDTDQLGGGAINEKQRTLGDDTASNTRHFDPLTQKSHLWHALEGLDRYPNYLSRWNDQDANSSRMPCKSGWKRSGHSGRPLRLVDKDSINWYSGFWNGNHTLRHY